LADTVPLLLVVPASLPITNVQELIAYVKAHPDEVSYASSGTGQIQHMSAELFKGMAGVEILHVPYKGSTFAHPDLISGRVTMMFDTVAALMPQVQAGTIAAAGGHHDNPGGRAARRTHHDRGRCAGLRYEAPGAAFSSAGTPRTSWRS
jgi:tripartite-type tricarboxylate transporter receptor subunit TctC